MMLFCSCANGFAFDVLSLLGIVLSSFRLRFIMKRRSAEEDIYEVLAGATLIEASRFIPPTYHMGICASRS